MAAAALAPEEAAEVLRGLEDRVAIAAVNDPRTVVLSGEPAALDTALERLTDCQVRVRALHVDYAFHSPQMAPLRAGFLAALGDVERQSGNVPMFSTVTGDRADGLALDASYWSRGIEEPVRFAQAVGASISAGLRAFVEVGPHPALVLNVAECLAARGVEGQSIATLKRGQDEHRSMLSALGALHVQGHPLDWARLFPTGGQVVTLPTYPWQRHRFPTHAAADQRQPSSVSSAGGDLIESACYELSWIRQEDATDRPEEEPDRFLILADQAGAGAALSRELAAAGKECALVSPNAPAEAAKRIDEAAGAGGPLQVVHLWGLDAPPTERLSPSSLEAVLDHASGSLVRLLPALAKLRVPPRLWVVTRGAQPVERAGVAVAQAPLWGLGRAIALEHPDLWGGLVDLDPAADGVDARDLAAVLLSAGDEDQIAIRDSVRYVPRLVATDLPRALEPLALRPDAAYLVTGGLAGLGLEVARWMVGQGARHLVLTGRTALPPRSQWDGQLSAEVRARVEAVRALEAQGAGVVAAAVDAGDSAEMERLISAISRPLAGVVHAAGVSSWLPLTGYGSEAALRETFLPKAAGALALHGLTRDMSLDFFILFSSAAAILGGRFQGHYAAANHFLDALAHERRALGLPAASLNWGLWAAGGMSTAESRERLEAIGHRPMPVGFGLSALERAVQCDRAQQTIASVDWKTFKDLYETRRRRRLLEVIVSDDQTGDQAASTDLVRRLSDLPPRAARQTLEELVSRSVAQVLGFPEDHVLAPNRGFFQLGLDSLMAMQLMKCLGAALGRELPAVVAFEHSTVASLSEHFAELLEIGAKEVEVGPPCERDFSEDELASRLAAKLAGTM
jgi:epothilone polyketide synthase E